MRGLRAALAAACLGAGAAEALELSVPVGCELGGDCYVRLYPDRDPGPGAADYRCGGMSYDGHKGVDFALRRLSDLGLGVRVLAAAGGVVTRTRDGEADGGHQAMTKGRDCGNAVVIDHGQGWETQYCHLAFGSVAVEPGDEVAAGAVLGRVGYSGATSFPHLHLSVRKDGAPVDPFDARGLGADCALTDGPGLWSAEARAALTYTGGGLIDAGFAGAPPKLANLRAAGPLRMAETHAPALIVWARFHGVRKGDLIEITLSRGGEVFAETRHRMERNRQEQMRFTGRRAPIGGWPPGVYEGRARLLRGGAALADWRGDVTLR